MKVLAGDLGGTHSRLEIVEVHPAIVDTDSGAPRLTPVRRHTYPSQDYPDPLPFLREFLAGETVAGACLAVAGPVEATDHGQRARVTNLPWRLDSEWLAAALGLPRLVLINDFAAVGHGLEALGPKDCLTLQPGRPHADAPRALIGAGTGLGMALLHRCQGRWQVHPSEGGHRDFAPTDALQSELLAWLRRRHEHVSVERVLSGPGLVNLYRFLAERHPEQADPALQAAMAEGDPAAAIAEFGLWRDDPLARRALHLFVRIYGAQAGDLALLALPRGGLYIAGGIAPKLRELMHGEDFLAALRAKGRMSALVAEIPVHLVLNGRVGLLGAALLAAREAAP